MEIEQKLKQLSEKYDVPEALLKEAIAIEKERLMYENRQCIPRLIKLITNYSEAQ